MKIYLDHNILDDLSKNRMTLEVPDDTIWVYSDENFNEIKRARDMRFLDVLRQLKARKLELEFDNQFRLTGRAFLHDYCEPKDMYQQWLDNINEIHVDECIQSQMQFLGSDSNLLIVFYVQIMPDDLVMQLHRF